MTSRSASPTAPSPRRLWIGTSPEEGLVGGGEGIWRVDVDTSTGELAQAHQAAVAPVPSFLALHPSGRVLYAVSEVEEGTVTAFAVGEDGIAADGAATDITGATLTAGNPVRTGSVGSVHVLVANDALWVASYGDGTATVLPLGPDGAITGTGDRFPHSGTSIDPERQDRSHAHSVGMVDGDAWVADLGTDEMRRYHREDDGRWSQSVAAVLPAGAGPRHFASLPGGAIVVAAELDAQVYVLAPAAAEAGRPAQVTYVVVARQEACRTPAPQGGRNYPSHVTVSDDGTRVFVAVRGADVVSTFAVEPVPDAVPRLVHLADTPVGGRWPRHFAVLKTAGPRTTDPDPDPVDSDLLVVANQRSSSLTVLRIDRDGGVGTILGTRDLPAPSCVVEG